MATYDNIENKLRSVTQTNFTLSNDFCQTIFLYSNANKNMYMLIKVNLHHKNKIKQNNCFQSKLKIKHICA